MLAYWEANTTELYRVCTVHWNLCWIVAIHYTLLGVQFIVLYRESKAPLMREPPHAVFHWRSIIKATEIIIHAQLTSIISAAQCLTVNYNIIYEQNDGNKKNKAGVTVPVGRDSPLDRSDVFCSMKGMALCTPSTDIFRTAMGFCWTSCYRSGQQRPFCHLECLTGATVARVQVLQAFSFRLTSWCAVLPLPSLSHN